MQTTTKSRGAIAALFTDHPASVDESYLEHMLFAAKFAGLLGLAAGAAVVHAIIPGLCQATAGKIIYKLHARMESRH